MRLLLINKFFWRKGGSEAVFFGEKELLEAHGHVVVPFSMRHPNDESSAYERYFVENVDYEKGGLANKLAAAGKIIYSFDARNKMSNLLKEIAPDVAHFHIFQHQISPSVFGPLKRRKVPLVLTLHDLKPICPNYKMLTHDGVCERCKGRKFYNCFRHKCSKGSILNSVVNMIEMYFHYAMGYYQGVDRFIAVSRFYRDKMIEFGFPTEQVIHIPNFVDTAHFDLSQLDEGYGLYFGRLSDEKGVMTLLKALKKIPEMPFLFVGTGPSEQAMRKKVANLGLKNVTFTGFKAGGELRKLIMASSFAVIPSEWYENCPMSVLESFAMGKPVIGSRIGGIPELIHDGVDGLTFAAGNPGELAGKMMLLWNDADRRRAMGRKGREKMEREFTPQRHYEQIIALYNELLGR